MVRTFAGISSLVLVVAFTSCGGTVETNEPAGSGGSSGTGAAAGSGGSAGAAGAGGTSTGGGAGSGGSSTCGDPDVMARYGDCLGADSKMSCEFLGGTWTTVGLAPYEECQCPTGQGGCPCASSTDCLTSCVGELDLSTWECENVKPTCSPVSITVGCWCYIDEEGTAQGICVD
jgi:hypothetical protein